MQITVLHHHANKKKKSVSGSQQNFGERAQSSGTCSDKCFIMYCLFTFDLVCRGTLCDTGCSLLYIIPNIFNVVHSWNKFLNAVLAFFFIPYIHFFLPQCLSLKLSHKTWFDSPKVDQKKWPSLQQLSYLVISVDETVLVYNWVHNSVNVHTVLVLGCLYSTMKLLTPLERQFVF